MLNRNGIECVCVCVCTCLIHIVTPLLCCDVCGEVLLLQTQKPRCHFGACMDHTLWPSLDWGQTRALLSVSFSLASNSLPHRKWGGGSLPSCSYTHSIDAKTKARRGDFAWNYD